MPSSQQAGANAPASPTFKDAHHNPQRSPATEPPGAGTGVHVFYAKPKRPPAGNGKQDGHHSELSSERDRCGPPVAASDPAPAQPTGSGAGAHFPDSMDSVLPARDAADFALPTPSTGAPASGAAPASRPASLPTAGVITMRDVMWAQQRKRRQSSLPPEFCPQCWDRWNRQLWPTSCVCTGHVSLQFNIPR